MPNGMSAFYETGSASSDVIVNITDNLKGGLVPSVSLT